MIVPQELWAAAAMAFLIACNASATANTEAEPGLVFEAKIPLGPVSGRIDHMAVDLGRLRLFVAELGDDGVAVVDLATQRLLRALTGFDEPQGLGYLPGNDMHYVANGGDGSVRLFHGAGLAPAGRIALDDDADDVRVDAAAGRVLVGHGKGALAVIDAARQATIADIALAAHPEGFEIEPAGARIFVNLPDARRIAVIDGEAGWTVAPWPLTRARGNFPMAFDARHRRILVVFRSPARLMALAAADGTVAADAESCGDADDVFIDDKRERAYVSCGEGYVDVFALADAGIRRIAHIATSSGARTSLLVPELDRLYLAVRATISEPAAIWIFRPAP
jgi:hypothetical protein